MPVFANVAAHTIIDTLTLLMWHKIFFLRVCRDASHLQHLKTLVDFYLHQCQPGPLPLSNTRFLCLPGIAMLSNVVNDEPV